MPDVDFYLNTYGGIPFDDIDLYLKRAAGIVDCAVIVPVRGGAQRYFDLAVCAEAEYIGTCGGIEGFTDSVNGNVSSLTVGSFSISKNGSSDGGAGTAGGSMLPCPAAVAFLDKAGLLGRWLTP